MLLFVNFSPTEYGSEAGFAGLFERILVTEIMVWYAAMSWRAVNLVWITQINSRLLRASLAEPGE
jgi:hypothetical protein